MSVTTTDLAAWLTQIWDEDQAVGEDADGDHYYLDDGAATGRFLECITPASVLARIAADRQILALHSGGVSYPEDCGLCNESLPCETVRLLASPYADRPGYEEAWKP